MKTLIPVLFFAATIPGWTQTCPAGSSLNTSTGVTVDTTASDHSNKRIHGSNWAMQTFTVEGSGCKRLNAVIFNVRRGADNGSDVGDLTVEIRTVSGGLPSGTVLGSKVVLKTAISDSAYGDVTAVFDTPIEISGGSQYAVVFYTTGGSAGKAYRFGVDDGNPYTGGQFCRSGDSGVTWGCTFEANSVVDMKLSLCVSDCPGGCVHSQGYWKNHPQAWPVTSLMLGLGTQSYSQNDLLTILSTSVGGNGLISLAHQLIAAKLNVAAGAAVPSGISAAIASADSLIGSLVVPPIGSDVLPPSSTGALTETLDQYNNGTYTGGPPHCDD